MQQLAAHKARQHVQHAQNMSMGFEVSVHWKVIMLPISCETHLYLQNWVLSQKSWTREREQKFKGKHLMYTSPVASMF